MNKHTRLLNTLDDVFGLDNKINSTFRKVSQSFDERTNEHVVLIEYRFRGKGLKSSPRHPPNKPLLRGINDRVKQSGTSSPTSVNRGQRTGGQKLSPRTP